jgi:hypothetical protein
MTRINELQKKNEPSTDEPKDQKSTESDEQKSEDKELKK